LFDVSHVLSAFSLALDIAENQPLQHAQRTAYIALQVSKELVIPSEDLQDLYIAALLHDIGITQAKADAHIDPNQLVSHCINGQQIVRSLPFVSSKAGEYIANHHANWDGNSPFQVSGKDISLGAQIIYLSDQIDLKLRNVSSIYTERDHILKFVQASTGSLFNPVVCEAFYAVQSREKFWLDYSTNGIEDAILSNPYNIVNFDLKDFETIATTFAKIIDNKSPFTHYHSQGVAELATRLAKHYGFDDDTVRMLNISGLLHDLGKLAIPNDILNKPDKLTPVEYQIVKSHAYYTKRILAKIKGFDKIKDWAGNHHEAIDGSGYPEGFSGSKLSIPERIITVCDIYHALVEERPYRVKPMSQLKVYEIMDDLAKGGKICPDVLQSLKEILR
jgi:putative nucleotidyltransferase with HDIG domain